LRRPITTPFFLKNFEDWFCHINNNSSRQQNVFLFKSSAHKDNNLSIFCKSLLLPYLTGIALTVIAFCIDCSTLSAISLWYSQPMGTFHTSTHIRRCLTIFLSVTYLHLFFQCDRSKWHF
jgi:hypothetical protein